MNSLTCTHGGYRQRINSFENIDELGNLDWLKGLATSPLHQRFSVKHSDQTELIWETKDGKFYVIGYFDNDEGLDKLAKFDVRS